MGERADSRIEDFVQKVREKYKITQAIFFGSRARGDHLADSDYDIVLVSPDFQGVFFSQRSALMYDFWQHWPLEIEPLCYTPEEFETKRQQIGIISEAVREGVSL
ncbi:MAG TPA: nucleotidyltransferase domain-containing protein [Sedimentisphaerales bacterium]|jgi:predicted nucleotidyltransferase|nr:nucleotidyltransferase domain-containing protein [Sedimentisphaerales bacterium]